MNDDLVERLRQFTIDYATGYMYDPDGEQLAKDMSTPVKDVLQEFEKIASNADFLTKEDYLKLTSRMNQYFGRIMDELNRIAPKLDKATERITNEIVDDIMNGNF